MIIIKDLAIFDSAKTRLILTIPELKITENHFVSFKETVAQEKQCS